MKPTPSGHTLHEPNVKNLPVENEEIRRIEAALRNHERCNICRRLMNDPADPTSLNCGGDCMRCLAEAGDPDCIAACARHEKKLESKKPL